MQLMPSLQASMILRGALLVSVLSTPAIVAQESGGEPPAVVIATGTVAQGQVVAVGRDLEVAGRAMRGAVSVGGTVRVSGEVEGDVVAVGGDVYLEAGAHVEGDAFVLGGRLVTRPPSVV